jgi:hypothetical protein
VSGRRARPSATHPRVLRRALLLVTSLTALAAAGPAVVHAAPTGGVRVVVNGDPGPRLPLSLLTGANADVSPTPMTTRYADGRETVDSHKGTSAQRLVVLAGLDPVHVTEMRIPQPLGSGSVSLSGAEVVGGFGTEALPATFDAGYNVTEVHFFRPQRDAGDVNAPDGVDPPIGRDLLVLLDTTGGVLNVSASANPAQAGAGTPIGFGVNVEGAPSDVTYAWDFGDGSDATTTGGTIVHLYTTEGSYDATVTAVARDGDSGAAIAHVQVGSLPGAPGGTAGGGGTTPQTGGGTGGRDATSTGRTSGDARRATGHGVAHGSDDTRVHDQPTKARRSAATPSAPRTAAAPPRPTAPRRAAPRPSTPRHSAPAPRHGRGSPAAGAAPHVSGVLLASSGDAASTLANLQRADRGEGRDAVARASATGAGSLRGWLLGGLALAALLSLGVAREAGLRLRARRPAGAA